jgi:hypothetical protein
MKGNHMKKLLVILTVLLLTSCTTGPTPTPTPTEIPQSTATPDPSEPGYIFSHKTPVEIWPEFIAGYPVAYVHVSKDVGLVYAEIWEDGYKLFTVYGETYNDRIIAKPGKWLAVYARGEIYGGNNWPRPFFGDGGNHAFQVMDEQIVDGVLIGDVGMVLFVPLASVDEWFDPRYDIFGDFDWID